MYPSSFSCHVRHVSRIRSTSIGARFLVLAVRVLAVKVVCWWPLSRCMIGSNTSNTCRVPISSRQHSSMCTSSFFCRVRHLSRIHSVAIPARFLVLEVAHTRACREGGVLAAAVPVLGRKQCEQHQHTHDILTALCNSAPRLQSCLVLLHVACNTDRRAML
jgi:hypothetical protein